jgi:pimeloyl-ACP methyl ester carboxylesterase
MKLLMVLALVGASASTPALAASSVPQIEWHKCQLNAADTEGAQLDQAGADCGDLEVPLDYSRPNGPKITVAMSRLKATGDRIGAMVLNDGGPGGPGLSMPLELRDTMKAAGTRYDLIGLDPRFVGRSTPIDCKLPFAGWPWSGGADRASFDRATRQQAEFAARCNREVGALLPYVTTRYTARDIDQLRIALGERKISYLGYSYGSYLGAVYLQMFPGRTDRVLLDGPANPDTYGPRLLQLTGPANEAALRAWATWAAARDSSYHLGKSTRQVLATVDRIYKAAADKGLRIGKYTIDDGFLPLVFFGPLGDDRNPARAEYSGVVQTLLKATNGPVPPDENLAAFLDAFLSPAASQPASVQTSIICGDVAAPRDPEVYWRDIQADRTAEPHFGTLTRMLSPCAFWPIQPREAPTKIANNEKALMVAATGDPRTIYPGAVEFHHKLTGSRLITLKNVRAHGIFGEYANNCVDTKVITYLVTGNLPTTDQTC